jgi:hypothetical protein
MCFGELQIVYIHEPLFLLAAMKCKIPINLFTNPSPVYSIMITILDIIHRPILQGVGVLLAADSQSTSKSEYRASLWDP